MYSIKHNQPLLNPDDAQRVLNVLNSGWLAQGSEVKQLEQGIVELNGGGNASAVSSGTAALFLGLKALGAQPGMRVATPTYACSALLNAVMMTGASPVLIDVLPDTFGIDCTQVKARNEELDIVIIVNTYGAKAESNSLEGTSLGIIEDCCHSIGGMDEDSRAVDQNSDIAIYSFYATKVIAAGQGGLVWAKSESIANKIRDYREFDCRERYEPRFNFQMSDITAALASSQLSRIDYIRQRRSAAAQSYRDALPLGFSSQSGFNFSKSMFYRFVIVSESAELRNRLKHHMLNQGIECAIPIQSYELLHRYLGYDASDFPVAESLADTTLSVPIHLGVSDDEVSYISDALQSF